MTEAQGIAALIASFSAFLLALLDRRRDSLREKMAEENKVEELERAQLERTQTARDEFQKLWYEERTKTAMLEAELKFLRTQAGLDAVQKPK